MAEATQPDASMVSDNFALSGATTPAQSGTGAAITQMEAADVESEFNNLFTIEQQSQSLSMMTDPSANPESEAADTAQDAQCNAPTE